MQQQQSPQNQQNVIPQPPNVITTKDQLYLTDMLSWNLLAAKKLNYFSQQCMDTEVKAALQQASQMHNRHYNTILKHLNQQPQQQQPNQGLTQ